MVCAKMEVSRPPVYPRLRWSGTRNPALSLPRLETWLPYNSADRILAATIALHFSVPVIGICKRSALIPGGTETLGDYHKRWYSLGDS